ncbi:extensin-like domain-containing protein [Aidingimonas lacisalsi]|uniref:extensin-like domain-containing protein n=1 Tax=Aidingimonas lacisalsi TaxID=2604086 RepID=UPI0011D1A4FB|nr:extensin family protein [Aidingimonas lacisalsi]
MRAILIVMILIIAGLGLDKDWWHIPRHWAPWTPLSVDDPLTPVTRWKLSQLEGDRDGCRQVLAGVSDAAPSYTALEDYTPVEECPLRNVVRLRRTGVDFSDAFVASCPMALAWIIYERQRLQPAAETILGSRVTAVEHYGSFACRNVYGRDQGRRSEHATAEALDVAAFRLADGRRIDLAGDWDSEGDAGRFLRAAQRGACDVFGTVLGPDDNAAHADHFHFGMRGAAFGC